MAFCTKCGKELAEGEVCSCQQEVAVAQPAEKKKLPKMLIPIVIGIAVVAVLLIVLIASLAGGKPYKKMLDKYVSLVNKQSTDVSAYDYALMAEGRVKLAKAVQKAYLKVEEAKELLEEEKEEKEEAYEDFSDDYEKWKLSYEIRAVEEMEEEELENYQKSAKSYFKDYMKPMMKEFEEILENEDDEIEDGADDLDISPKEYKALVKATLKQYKDLEDIEISQGYEVKVKFFVKTKDDEYKTDTIKVAVLKVNGDWVYAGPARGEIKNFYFDESDLKFLVSPLNKSYMYE